MTKGERKILRNWYVLREVPKENCFVTLTTRSSSEADWILDCRNVTSEPRHRDAVSQ